METITMVLRHIVICTILFVSFSTPNYSFDLAQNIQSSNQAARKIDEYKVKDLAGHDEQMRLWSAFDDLAKEPKDTRLFIIAYSNLPGGGKRFSNRAKNYLVSTHGVAPARIVVLDGGFRDDSVVEIWLVPIRAQVPVSKPSGTFVKDDAAWKYDEFSLDGWWLGDYGSCCERQPERLDGFAAVLKSNPRSKAYIVVHRGTISCATCLELGTALRFARSEKEYLVKKHRIAASRISVINAGRVGGGRVQLWIAPVGEVLPKAKYRLRDRS